MPDPIPLSPEAERAIREMKAKGLTWTNMAVALGVSRAHVVKWAKQLNLHTPNSTEALPAPIPLRPQGLSEGLPAFHPIAIAVLRNAGLPIEPPTLPIEHARPKSYLKG